MLNSATLSAETLASIFAQSVDCVKLIGLDGTVRWMNANGQCAMEIDDFCAVEGASWQSLWPDESQALVTQALEKALAGETARFDAFCPTAKGTPRWWSVTTSAVEDVDGSKAGFLSISRDITATQQALQAQAIAAAELRHRLRNTYAMVSALIGGFARGNAEHEAFARDMQERLTALSVAQSLFATDDAPCDLASLIPALVTPFASPVCTITIGNLDCTQVKQEQANAIALVIGELGVNSAKHGAAASGGVIQIETMAVDGHCTLVWTEEATRRIGNRDRPGAQGLTLISRIMQARGGTLEIVWGDHGPIVTMGFPLIWA